ncbi:hypothetical protein [Streptomyces sp. TS71-3]|uniref:hypothetical protein n=1 Tax=Streptomyces sp. TS71-3 TaxID=2733862 RepID=UPI001B274AE2|nr:hypothetical protein [Streptomyces sp. TS71-3]GHJ35190.1 hypothetical protein Sm713_07990 [Streptomyces sp. TS71-3]
MADESRVFPEDTGDPLRAPGMWLDEATAEGLLSGVSPDALAGGAGLDPRGAAELVGLVKVLNALREQAGDAAASRSVPAAGAAGELPGEAAALAAFRHARDTASRGVAADAIPPRIPQPVHGRRAEGEPSPVEIGSVHLAGGTGDHATRGDHFRWRPLRFGLAATLAGCMLGGAAVVAGLLPSPVGGLGRPGPAVSVSGAETPDGSDPSAGGSGSGAPRSPGDPAGPGGSGAPSGGSDGRGGEQGHGKDKKDGAHGTSENWWAKMVSACQDYRGGKPLDGKSQHDLEKAANGSERVAHFCEGLLADQGGPGKENGAPPAQGPGNHDTSGNDTAGNEGDDGGPDTPDSGGGPKNDAPGDGAGVTPSATDSAPTPSTSSETPAGVTFSDPPTQ